MDCGADRIGQSMGHRKFLAQVGYSVRLLLSGINSVRLGKSIGWAASLHLRRRTDVHRTGQSARRGIVADVADVAPATFELGERVWIQRTLAKGNRLRDFGSRNLFAGWP